VAVVPLGRHQRNGSQCLKRRDHAFRVVRRRTIPRGLRSILSTPSMD
jgi:hypothetical protein